jgi:hypothetical protein
MTFLQILQLGYLLAIPRTEQMKEEKDFEMEGLEFVVSFLFLHSYIHSFINVIFYKVQ